MWQTILIGTATGILKMALPLITTELRKMMIDAVEKWEAYAKETPYNWDNLVVGALHGILCITDKDVKLPESIAPGI